MSDKASVAAAVFIIALGIANVLSVGDNTMTQTLSGGIAMGGIGVLLVYLSIRLVQVIGRHQGLLPVFTTE